MNAKELVIAIKSLFDPKGTAEAQKQLDATGKKAAEASNKQGGAFQALQARVGKVTSAVGALRNLLTGFGLAGAIVAVVGQFKAIADNVKKATEEANRLQDEIGSLDAQGAIPRAQREFKALAESISQASAQAKAAVDDEDRTRKAFRDYEDAYSKLAEAKEKASLSPTDALYAERSAEIAARYAAERASVSGQRAQEDAGAQRRRIEMEIESERAAQDLARRGAAGEQGRANRLRQHAEIVRKEGTEAERRAPWWKLGWFGRKEHDYEAEKAAAEKAAALRSDAAKAEEQVASFGKAVAEAESRIRDAVSRRSALNVSSMATRIEGEAQTLTSASAVSETERATAAARIRDRLAGMTSRAGSAADAYKTRADVFRAEADAFDPQRRNYGSRDDFMRAKNEDRRLEDAAKGAARQSAAVSSLLKQLESTPPEKIAALLGGIESQLRAFESAIKNAEQRSRRQ